MRWISARLSSGVVLAGFIGSNDNVTVNELTTVAMGYSFAQFLQDGKIRGDERALTIARGMAHNLVDPRVGLMSTVMERSPNADQTNSRRSLNSLANALTAAVNSGPGAVLDAVRPPGTERARDTLQAVADLARSPGARVSAVWSLTRRSRVWTPALSRQPDAWTIVVKVNDTGDRRHMFGGPANVAFDERGFGWISNNVKQGTGTSARFNVVLRPNGRPARGRWGEPPSVLTGGGILGTGFGIAVGPDGRVWSGNFGWGGDDPSPGRRGNGSVSCFAPDGRPLSGRKGIQGGPDRAQGIAVDADGNVWIASFGNDRVYVFPGGDPSRAVWARELRGASPFEIRIAQDGTAWVTNPGGLYSRARSSVSRYELTGTSLRLIWRRKFGRSLKGMSLDSRGQAWIASGGDNCVYLMSDEGEILNQFRGGGMDTPWATTVDGADNVWVANFGPEEPGSNFTTSSVTNLAGANPETRPRGLSTGDPISPATGYTLASAGQQVLLADGTPLYGRGAPPSFSPLMRLTSTRVDRAGNVWAINNWKPRFDVDAINPGGDGICIFVGLAAPVSS
jgi:hypothetical protein